MGDPPPGRVQSGRLLPGEEQTVAVPVPRCAGGGACAPVQWTLKARGRPAEQVIPGYGAPGEARKVKLALLGAAPKR